MKTIQQRADDYVGHPEEIDEFSYATIKRQAFIEGARAQRALTTSISGRRSRRLSCGSNAAVSSPSVTQC